LTLLGALLLVVAAGLLGERAAAWERYKLDLLENLLVGLLVLRAEIDYLATDLAAAMRRAAGAAPAAAELFAGMAEELAVPGMAAGPAWRRVVGRWCRRKRLDGRLPGILSRLEAAFGPWQAAEVVRHLELVQKLLIQERDERRAKLDGTVRLWRYLGICGGLTAALLLC